MSYKLTFETTEVGRQLMYNGRGTGVYILKNENTTTHVDRNDKYFVSDIDVVASIHPYFKTVNEAKAHIKENFDQDRFLESERKAAELEYSKPAYFIRDLERDLKFADNEKAEWMQKVQDNVLDTMSWSREFLEHQARADVSRKVLSMMISIQDGEFDFKVGAAKLDEFAERRMSDAFSTSTSSISNVIAQMEAEAWHREWTQNSSFGNVRTKWERTVKNWG